jgi:hypothetical protein
MKATQFEHCERTGRMIGHCGCGDCYAKQLAKMVRTDSTLRTPRKSQADSPRYLVVSAL